MLATLGAYVTALKAAPQPPVKIGVDLYSIRLNNWTPVQYLDYLSKIDVQVAHLSAARELSPILTNEAALKEVRSHAQGLGIGLEVAMGSVCPTAKEFNPKLGTAEEQITRVLNAARVLGAPVVRVFLGAASERAKAMPIETHMESTVRVFRNLRQRILDSGVRVAMENHGDFQARELKAMVEETGKDILAVCLDSGNPPYVMEDPQLTLEMLAPYTVTSHIRDTAVWRTPEGVAVQWVRVGDGSVGLAEWIRNYIRLCPGIAVSIENIVSSAPQVHRVYDTAYWDSFPKMPAWEFARFLAIAERGRPAPPITPVPGRSPGAQQCEDLEASIREVRRILG